MPCLIYKRYTIFILIDIIFKTKKVMPYRDLNLSSFSLLVVMIFSCMISPASTFSKQEMIMVSAGNNILQGSIIAEASSLAECAARCVSDFQCTHIGMNISSRICSILASASAFDNTFLFDNTFVVYHRSTEV